MAWKPFGINVSIGDVVNFVASPAAAIVGKKVILNKDEVAGDYVANRLPSALSFAGSKADLEALISQHTDSCESYVKGKGVLVSGARDVCYQKITAAYADVIAARQSESYQQELFIASAAMKGNNGLYLVLGLVFLVVLLIILF